MRLSIESEFGDIEDSIRLANQVSESRVDEKAEEATDELAEYIANTAGSMGLFGLAPPSNPDFDKGPGMTITQSSAYRVVKNANGFYRVRPRRKQRKRVRSLEFGTERYVDANNPMVFQDTDGNWVTVGTPSNPHPGIEATRFITKAQQRFERDGVLEKHLEDVADDIARIIRDG